MISVPSEPLPRPAAKWPTGVEVWHKPHWGPHSSKLQPQPDHLPSFALSCPCPPPCNHAGYLLSPTACSPHSHLLPPLSCLSLWSPKSHLGSVALEPKRPLVVVSLPCFWQLWPESVRPLATLTPKPRMGLEAVFGHICGAHGWLS